MTISSVFPEHSKDFEAIQTRIGRLVYSLSHDLYFFNGTPDEEDDGSLEISFSDSTFLTLRLASDGETVKATVEALPLIEPFYIDEGAHCSWQRIVLTDDKPWSIFRNSRMVAIDALIDRWQKLPSNNESVTGWVLRFETGNFITYWNCGDNAKVFFNELPPPMEGVETRLETVASGRSR